MEFVIKWAMPRLFPVSLARVCARGSAPSFGRPDIIILSISAAQHTAKQQPPSAISLGQRSQRRELGQCAREITEPYEHLETYGDDRFFSPQNRIRVDLSWRIRNNEFLSL